MSRSSNWNRIQDFQFCRCGFESRPWLQNLKEENMEPFLFIGAIFLYIFICFYMLDLITRKELKKEIKIKKNPYV